MRETADLRERGPAIGPAEVAAAIRVTGYMPSTAAAEVRLQEARGRRVHPALRLLADYDGQRRAVKRAAEARRNPPVPAWKVQNDRLRRKLDAAMR